jgi:photosystem I protein
MNSYQDFAKYFIELREQDSMTGKTVTKTGKPPYTFRTSWALLLLLGNFIVAAFYFGILK